MQRELSYTELKNGCSADDFSFRSTAELEPLEGIIGQDRAVKAFDFGLHVKSKAITSICQDLPAQGKPPMPKPAQNVWRQRRKCLWTGAMFITSRTPEARWHCLFPLGKAENSGMI